MVAVILAAGAAASPPDAPGWVHGAAATGAVVTGMDAIGTTGTAIGVITITITMMSSSLVVLAFQGGGAGDIQDITAMGTRTVTTGTAMAIRTDTAAMDTVTTATATATVTAMATVLAGNTVLAANMVLRLGRE